MMKTVYEQAIETGETTFWRIWGAIQEGVATGMSHEAIADALRASLRNKRMSAKFWQWFEDATTAARHRSAIEADRRRRQFRLVKGKENER
jgi:hypothetical protein